jgi:putative ABC transport system substrate-binding protein
LVILLLGGAVFLPREGRTQQRSIGFLSAGSADAYAPFVAAFRSALNEAGYVEGRNLAIEFRWAEGHYDRLPELAADLVRSKPEVIVTSGGDIVIGAAKAATAAIPIVFTSGGDPVARGFVASLARPGGNMTGVSLLVIELVPKRLEFLQELVPDAAGIAGLVNPKNSNAGRNVAALREAARAKGVQLHIVEASSEGDFETAFASLAPLHAGALVVGADPFFNARRSQIVGLAARHSMPAIYEWREVRRCRRIDQLRPEPTWDLPSDRRLCRPHSRRREARRSPRGAADAVRARRQSQDRKDTRPRGRAIDPRPRRRSD